MSLETTEVSRYDTFKEEVADEHFQVALTGEPVEGQLTFEAFK